VQERLLDVLASEGVVATFFIQGRWAEAYPEAARRIARAGHLVGNHSYYHARMTFFSRAAVDDDVDRAERVIRRITRTDPRPWFRFPFGNGADRPALLDMLDARGYRHVGWDVDSKDWRRDRTAAGLRRDVTHATTASGDETVVLFHTWPRATIAATPGIIADLREAGARFVRVDELESPTTTVTR
jgi:peptidoglycan-N-acetylglucosamine deacetylase